MRLNLQQIMHVPGASIPFAFQLDLSQEAFFGEYPISRPVTVTGHVKNVADVLMLEGEAKSLLDYTCDRCMCRFSREKAVSLHFLLAGATGGGRGRRPSSCWTRARSMWGNWPTRPSFSIWTQNTYAQKTARGLCPGCGVSLNQAPCRCVKSRSQMGRSRAAA